ncbi:MAG: glycosyltransferase family 4 protein [Acidimicrobiales bacterium]
MASAAAPLSGLRIAHVTDFYHPRVGGIENHVASLARAQRAAGHRVEVITAGGVVERDGSPVDTGTARSGSARESFCRSGIRAAHRAVTDGRYDIVHVHAGLATPLAFSTAGACSRAGTPTVVTMHSMVGDYAACYRQLDRFVGWRRWPVVFTAVSAVAAGDLQVAVGDAAPVFVLPNATEVDTWRGAPIGPHEGVVVAAVMRLTARKRPLPLLRILHRARQAAPAAIGLRAVIVGDGPYRRPMERYLARHGMASWVSLPGVGSRNDIRALFERSDLFVAPALKESFGIAALEARAAGLPVVAHERTGIGEFVEHGVSGLLVDGDAAMATAIATLASDTVTRARLTRHNRAVAPPFGWAEALDRTAEIYRLARAIQGSDRAATATPMPVGPGTAARHRPNVLSA